jgi:hypothetical protein
MKKRIELVLVLGVFFLSSGCAAGPALQLLGGAAITGYYVKTRLDAMDVVETIEFPLEEVWAAAILTAAEMDIIIIEKELQKQEGVLKGKTQKHRVVEIAMESVTPTITEFGVKARENKAIAYIGGGSDRAFASVVLSEIAKKCRGDTVVVDVVTKATPPKMKSMLKTIHQGLIRRGPGPKYKIIVVVPSGVILFDLGQKKGSWHKVQTESGKIGFIYYTVVRPVKDIKFKDETDSKTKGFRDVH